jgi:hypothetical protein
MKTIAGLRAMALLPVPSALLPHVYWFRSVPDLKANSLREADSAGYYDELHR